MDHDTPQGLSARYVQDGQIDRAQWQHACHSAEPVGTCRECGEPLMPRRPRQVGQRVDFEAVCGGPGAHELLAPYGRVGAASKGRAA